MAQIPMPNPASQGKTGDTRPLLSKYFRNFLGVYTRASRTAIPDDYFYNLENIIPIGPQNAHVVPNISGVKVDYGADLIYRSTGLNLNGTEVLINFSTSGKVFLYSIPSQTSTQINAGNLLSGSGSQCTQWKNTAVLFIDSTGFYSYDGTTFAKITGTGVPTSGNAIAVYASRVWIAQNRLLLNSGVDDFSAASWTAANGAAATNLTDPTIRSKVFRLISANGYLYIFSVTGISAVSNVYVPSGANPPTPVFTLQNLQALIGTDQVDSVIPYDRNVMFSSRYGIHNLIGVDAPKISSDIDGTWQFVDFGQPISAGQVVVENILCGAFLIKRLNDPNFGSNPIIVLWYSNDSTNQNSGIDVATDIWWFANFGALTLISTGLVNNTPALFGFIGNKMFQLFADTTTAPETSVWTKLYPMEDELARKQVIQIGMFADFNLYGSSLQMSVDTSTSSVNANLNVSAATIGQWITSARVLGFWQNSSLQTGGWVGVSAALLTGIAPPAHDHYVGLRIASQGYSYVLHLMAMDYKLENRWM